MSHTQKAIEDQALLEASEAGLHDPSADIGPQSSGERAHLAARAEEIEREDHRLGLLSHYERGCAAIAAARSVDEVRKILDLNAAMRAYAKQAKNRDLEADAVEIRLRAIRRLDQLRQAQAASIGLATGGEHGGRRRKIYPVHVMTRKSFGLMTRKLSVTESQRSAQFPGTFSRRKLSVASANWAQVA